MPRGHQVEDRLDSREAWTEREQAGPDAGGPPSIRGLFGFAGATFMVASLPAGWWGDPATAAPVIAPFALFFGGLAQLLAGVWSYRARDGVATAMHGTWGSRWLGWGLLVLLTTMGVLPASVLTSRAFGFRFIVLSVVTVFARSPRWARAWCCSWCSGCSRPGSILLPIGFVAGVGAAVMIGGWVPVSPHWPRSPPRAMMLAQAAKGRTLPLGKYRAAANVPGRLLTEPVEYPAGMPRAKVGQ